MSVTQVSAAQAQRMQSAGALVLDVREPWELAIASVDAALNIPMQQIPSALAALPKDQEILCLCHHGMRSMNVAHFLVAQGFQKIYNITGGCDAWSREVDASVARY